MAIQLSKNGNAVKFDFDDNSHYLNDGTIEVPVNSLTLVTDESDMFTFKKAASDDIFISGLYEEIGMSKSELIAWYKDNMVGSTGGSGSGVTEEWVEEYVSESISGKADISDVATVSGDVSLLSEQVETDEKVTANALVDLDNRKLDASAYTPTDLSNYYTKSQTNTQINNATDGLLYADEFYEYTGNNNERVGDIEDRLSEDEEVTSAALNELNDALDDKADTTAVTASIAAAVSGKQDTLISGTNIKTINNESLIGSGNIDIQGGGKAIEAGRGISITTGATADTVSFDLPLSASTDDYSSTDIALGNNLSNETNGHNLKIGKNLKISGATHYAIGISHKTNNSNDYSILKGDNSVGLGYFTIDGDNAIGIGNVTVKRYGAAIGYASNAKDFAVAIGFASKANGIYSTALSRCTTNNNYEFGCGAFNNSVSGSSTFGDSGNTLFSVGNGTDNARHNAFEIRQNGDIYITKDGSDVKLQDQLGGGGLPESAFTAYTAATDARLAEDEEVTAAALNTLNTALGGFKLVSISQADYDLLPVKDQNTLYIITNVVN